MSSILSSDILKNGTRPVSKNSASLLTRACRKLVVNRILSLEGQPISINDRSGSSEFRKWGEADCEVTIEDPRFYRRVVTGGSMGAAESYIQGEWDCDNLTDLLRVFVRQLKQGKQFTSRYSKVSDFFSRTYHWARRNTRLGSKRNIAAHYDLGNDFFKLMLDETMTYSSGCFPQESLSLKAAQVEKYSRLCQLLDLQETDHLLEIGTGWGGMAIFAASHFGCKVTTTTISKEQYEFAKHRIQQLGLQEQINVLLKDYRDLDGEFDKLVSIEMIEAVGHKFLPLYFDTCSKRLKRGGRFALQAISMPDQSYRGYLRRADFIQRYVFPGSCCPAMGALVDAFSQTDFRFESTSNIGLDYATTLRKWRENVALNLDSIRELGYGAEFLRLWNYYLCYCEAGFAESYLSNHQILLSKGGLA